MKQGISLPQIPKNLQTDNKELYDYLFGLQQALLAKQRDDYGAVDKTRSDLTDLTTAFNDYVDYSAISFASGYINFKNGMQIRWGSFTSDRDTAQTVSFGSSFSTACLAVVTSITGEGVSPTVTTSSFTINRLDTIDGTPTVYYIAIGH